MLHYIRHTVNFLAILFVCLFVSSCIRHQHRLGVSGECASPIPYEERSISLNVAYGIIGIGGSYKARAVKGIEKSLHIYYDQAAFLCEEHRKGNLSDDDYMRERRKLALEFSGMVDMSQRSIKQKSESSFNLAELMAFAAKANINYKEIAEDQMPSWHNEESVIGNMYIIGDAGIDAEGRWQDTVLASFILALSSIAGRVSTQISSKMQVEKSLLHSSTDMSSELSFKDEPSFNLKQKTLVRKYIKSLGQDASSVEKYKQTISLQLPDLLYENEHLKYQYEAIIQKDNQWVNTAWAKSPEFSAQQLHSLVKLITRLGIKVTNINYSAGKHPILWCRLMLDTEEAKAKGLDVN